MTTRPWYHRPEWITLLVLAAGTIVGGATAVAHNESQIGQNTKDIGELRGQIAAMPERLARIEQKVDDLRSIEAKRQGGE